MKTLTNFTLLTVLFAFASPLWAADLTNSDYARKIATEEVDAHVINGSTRLIIAQNISDKDEELTISDSTDPEYPDIQFLGNTDVGKWVEYRIDVQKGGNYYIYPRVASPKEGWAFDVEIDGESAAYFTGRSTGSWDNWIALKRLGETVNLEQGIHTLRLKIIQEKLNLNILYFEYDDEPFTDDIHVINGTTRLKTALRIYDKDPGITVAKCTDSENPDVTRSLANIDTDRWIEYQIDVQKGGSYTLYPRLATTNTGWAFEVDIDGAKVATFEGNGTGGWDVWTTKDDQAQSVDLEAGTHRLTLRFTQKKLNLTVLYFEYNAHVINGTSRLITAQKILSKSSTIGPNNSTDSENPDVTKHLGNCNAGEWAEYRIEVEKGGNYRIYPRLASNSGTGAFDVDIDDVTAASFTAGGPTGGWTDWTTRENQAVTVNLTPGTHTLRLIFTATGLNLNILYFEYNDESSLIENKLKNDVKIYPNPVQRGQEIRIDAQPAQGETSRIDLYDFTGKRVASFEITGNKTNLPAIINPGLYLLKITGRELYKEAKIVVL